MPRQPDGTYTKPLDDVQPDTVVESAWANQTFADMADGITDSLSNQGKGGLTGPFKHVDGSALDPAITFDSDTSTGFFRNAATGKVHYVKQGVDLGPINESDAQPRFFIVNENFLVTSEPLSVETQDFIVLPAGAHSLHVAAPFSWGLTSKPNTENIVPTAILTATSTGSGTVELSTALRCGHNCDPSSPTSGGTGRAARTFDNDTLTLELAKPLYITSVGSTSISGEVLDFEVVITSTDTVTLALGIDTSAIGTGTGYCSIGKTSWIYPSGVSNNPDFGLLVEHTTIDAGDIL